MALFIYCHGEVHTKKIFSMSRLLRIHNLFIFYLYDKIRLTQGKKRLKKLL